MEKSYFDVEAFYSALDRKRASRKITWKKVASESGVSASTFTRMAQLKRPDVDSMAKLADWSGLMVDNFIVRTKEAGPKEESIEEVSAYLRADKNLDPRDAEALEAVLFAAYEKLKKMD